MRSNFINSFSFRSIAIALLSLALMAPLMLLSETIKERGQRYHRVLDDIAAGWGRQQTITGPILVVPYVEHVISVNTETTESGENKTVSKDIFQDKTMVLLPEELDIKAGMQEQYRKRGIYNSLVYTADLTLAGHFNIMALTKACDANCRIDWNKAWVAIGIRDTRAIAEASRFIWDGTSIGIEPGTRLVEYLDNGFHAAILGNQPQTPLPSFRLTMKINGSKGLRFAPLGEVTTARITSTWPHPSFQGQLLPREQDINNEGFSARWQIPNLARKYPQYWTLEEDAARPEGTYDLTAFTTGVDLFEPLDLYAKISRATQYGIFLIALTFAVFAIFELTAKTRPHFIQYALVGLSLSLFYLVLISLAERFNFLHAYVAAAGSTVLLITLYSIALLRKFSRALLIGLLLAGMFALLYVTLHLEDYALLAGAGLLTIVVMVAMLMTRRIDPESGHETGGKKIKQVDAFPQAAETENARDSASPMESSDSI